MRPKILILIVCFWLPMLLCGCDTKTVLVISLGGISSTDIHDVVEETVGEYGIILTLEQNWLQDSGDTQSNEDDTQHINNSINTLVSRNGGDKSNLSLLVVGKSSGGVLAWDTFRRHFNDIDDFHRVSLVLVDSYGAAKDDGLRGPYCNRHDLWWPGDWSSDTDFFRVYNVYQHVRGFEGANFPDDRVFQNSRLVDADHDNITGHECTRGLIYQAISFAHSGEQDYRPPLFACGLDV